MIVAAFGLLGVIVGGLLSGIVSAGLERLREARRALVTARLVQDDLAYIKSVLEVEIEQGVWKRLTNAEPPLPFTAWVEGRAVLAAHLSYAEWASASIAARVALQIVERAPTNPKQGKGITPNERAQMETVVPRLAKGIDVLQPLSHGARVPSLPRAMFGGKRR